MNVYQGNNFYRILVAIGGAILGYLIVALCIYTFYNPDIEALKASASKITICGWGMNPEPVEKALYLSGLVFIPLLIVIILYLIRNRIFTDKEKLYLSYGSVILYTLVGLSSLFVKDAYSDNIIGIALFERLFQYDLRFVFLSLSSILFILLYYYRKKISPIIFKTIYYFGIVFLLIIPLLISLLGNSYSFPPGQMHFDALFYSQVQVQNGTPMLYDGFKNTYGLYPHFLQPIFSVIGLSILHFSAVLSCLIVLSFICIYWFLLRETRNKYISLLTIGTIIYSYLYWRHNNNDSYFQLFPIRVLFPSVLLLLSSFYKEHKSFGFFILISFFTSLDILWNPDMGIFTYLSWIAFALYMHTYEHVSISKKIKNAAIVFLLSIIVVIITFALYTLFIYTKYQVFPNLYELFSTIFVFSGLGFYMLPMQLFHPWIIVAMWILIALAISIVSYNKQSKSDSTLFILTLIVIGFFSYYQGRSHTQVFAGVGPIFILLLGVLLSKIISYKNTIEVLVFKISSFAIVCMAIPAIVKFDISFMNNRKVLYENTEMDEKTKSNIQFIKKHTHPGEKILITHYYNQGIYYNETKTVAIFNPGYVELFFVDDVNRLLKMVNEKPMKIFSLITEADPKFKQLDNNGVIGLYINPVVKNNKK